MFEVYTAVIIIGVFAQANIFIIMLADEVLPRKNKYAFVSVFSLLIFVSVFEWLVMYFEYSEVGRPYLSTIFMCSVFFLSEVTVVLQALATDDFKTKKISVLVFLNIIFAFIISYSALWTDLIFYYDSNNVYHRGDFFIIFIFSALSCILTMFYSSYRLSKRYHTNNRYVLLFLSVFFLGGFIMQFATSNDILWIIGTFTASMLYIYYSDLISQHDSLTGLLNRRCYENQKYFLKTEARILLIDINKFKQINDTYGHAFGDRCLSIIGEEVQNTYGKVGYCFRIGGDEFCVIMTKELDKVEIYNRIFVKSLEQKVGDINLPTTSIGWGAFYPEISNIQKVAEEADNMMYRAKKTEINLKKR